MRKGDWMQTYTGRQFWPLDPHPDEIDIRDIAHALSMMCRYGGHVDQFYSVAEHSVLISHNVPPEHAMEGLMHDASEAYLVDVPRPIKRDLIGYRDIEAVLERAVADKFGMSYPWPDEVKNADNRILNDERDQLMKSPPMKWAGDSEPLGVTCVGLMPREAEAWFLDRYLELQAIG